MRRFLLIVLVCLLPLQSFAAVVMAFKMNNDPVMAMDMNQTATPCHDDAKPAASDNLCCSSPAVCRAMCSLSCALLPAIALQPVPTVSEDKPLGLSVSYMSAALALPIKPPIL